MRLVYTADLHGDLDSYQALLDYAVSTGAQAAIVGGDLLPHAIKLDVALQIQRDFINTKLRPLLEVFHRQHPEIKIYLLAGNDDWAAAISALDDLEKAGLAYPLHERVYPLISDAPLEQRLWIAGYACVPITPFSIKDFERCDVDSMPPFSFRMAYASWSGAIESITAGALLRQPSITRSMEQLAVRSNPLQTIYVCHAPPANTALDHMPRDRHIGSEALRTFIETHTPPLTLHGHAHEAPQVSGQYAIRLGPTWSVNPGHDQRRFQAIALDTSDIAGSIEHTVFGRISA